MNNKTTVLLITLFLGLQTLSFSQTEQFKLFVGGSGNFKSNSVTMAGTTSTLSEYYGFNITPKIGVFIIKNLALGIDAEVNYINYSKGNEINKSIVAGPLARYYFRIKKCGIFLEAAYNYGKGSTYQRNIYTGPYSSSQTPYTTDSKLNAFSGGLGFSYFIKETVGLELMYQRQYITQRTTNTSPYSYYGPSITNVVQNINNINLGFLFYF